MTRSALPATNNPRVHMATSDIDAAAAEVDAARAKFGPEIVAEGRARIGDDIDGDDGDTNDLQARLVLRWNLYRGGIDKANEQEQIRRASEQRMVLHQVYREIEEAVRISWERRFRQAELAASLAQQASASAAARRVLSRAVQSRPALAARRARRAEHAFQHGDPVGYGAASPRCSPNTGCWPPPASC